MGNGFDSFKNESAEASMKAAEKEIMEKARAKRLDEEAKKKTLETLSNNRVSLPDDAIHFAEWMDIVCVRDGRFEWKYKVDNYTKKHTTKEMYEEWLKIIGNES